MKKKDYTLIVAYILIVISISLFFVSIIVKHNSPAELKEQINYSTDVIQLCNKNSIVEDADCTNKWVNSFFKYNLSQVGKDLNFTKLREYGGVCSHWADLYCSIGKKFGFYTKRVIIDMDNETAHAFCVWSNENHYIVLDQRDIEVHSLK